MRSYRTPDVQVGALVTCAIHGRQRVSRFTTGPIRQPVKSGRGTAIIVCGDLERALHIESSLTIQRLWGVSRKQVARWRKALGIGRVTEGTRQLLQAQGRGDIGVAASIPTHCPVCGQYCASRRAANEHCPRPDLPPKTKIPNARKLAAKTRTEERAAWKRQIVRQFLAGETQSDLARKHGVSRQYIHAIVQERAQKESQ